MNCTATTGFLTLGSCGNLAVRSCTQCGRPTCTPHLSPTSGFSMCYSCAATQPAQEKGEDEEEVYDESWVQGYRSSYYSETGYSGARSTYDRSDGSSFDHRADDGFDNEDDSGGFDAS
jgi:hypothetical protein